MFILRIILGFFIAFTSMAINSIVVAKISKSAVKSSLKLTVTTVMLASLYFLAKRFYKSRINTSLNVREMARNVGIFTAAFFAFALLRIICDLFSGQVNIVHDYIATINTIGWLTLINLFLIAISEELIFRYYLTSAICSSGINVHISIILSSILFSLVHANQYSYVILIHIFIFGLTFCMLFIITKSIAIPIALHMQHNLFSVSNDRTASSINYSFKEVFLGEPYVMVLFVMLAGWWFYKKTWRQPIARIYEQQ